MCQALRKGKGEWWIWAIWDSVEKVGSELDFAVCQSSCPRQAQRMNASVAPFAAELGSNTALQETRPVNWSQSSRQYPFGVRDGWGGGWRKRTLKGARDRKGQSGIIRRRSSWLRADCLGNRIWIPGEKTFSFRRHCSTGFWGSCLPCLSWEVVILIPDFF